MKLVIVESPAKCKKIEEYLGTPYKCMASYGHFRVLNDLSQIDVLGGYQVAYEIDKAAKKRQQVARLREAIAAADEVILATDDDREGEAIAWHICDTFRLPIATTPRAVFHEITEGAVCDAVASPRTINMALVAAAQARQVIDLLVGFKITPLLWRYVSSNRENPLSAGRCQTPALRLIYDNDMAARESEGVDAAASAPTYRVSGYFTTRAIPFELQTPDVGNDPTAFLTSEHAAADHRYEGHSEPKTGPHAPPRPFTTSRLQQAAGGGVKETMKNAQTLYEAGHITYMRTDAQTYSAVFVSNAHQYIAQRWGAAYVNASAGAVSGAATAVATAAPKRKPKAGTGNVTPKPQEAHAHEAIRPTRVEFTPEQARTKLGPREARLYELIWSNTVKSLMSAAQVATYTASVVSPITGARYTHACSKIRFPGWKIVGRNSSSDGDGSEDIEDSSEWEYLQRIAPGSLTPYITIKATPVFKAPPPHHSEAGLVKMLEEMGIGRPSTFATLVDKIQERDYVQKKNIEPQRVQGFEYVLGGASVPTSGTVIKTAITKEIGGERGKLLLQPIGRIVSDFLHTHFSHILNYEYTCAMEKALDDVAAGIVSMREVCGKCDTELESCIMYAADTAVKIQHSFGGGARPRKGTPELIVGRQGAVIKMSAPDRFIPLNPPYCDTFNLALFSKIKTGEILLSDLIPSSELNTLTESGDNTPLATASIVDLGIWGGKRIYVKTGKFGPYVSLVAEAEADAAAPASTTRRKTAAKTKTAPTETRTLKPLGIRTPLTQYTRDEVIALLEGRVDDPKIVRRMGADFSIRIGPKGSQYIFYKTPVMKKPTFYKLKGFLEDPANCDEAVLMDWIVKKYPACEYHVGPYIRVVSPRPLLSRRDQMASAQESSTKDKE